MTKTKTYIEERDEEYTYESEGARCPYCGHMNRVEDSDYTLASEDCTEYECGECEKEFQVDFHVIYSWTCTPKEDG